MNPIKTKWGYRRALRRLDCLMKNIPLEEAALDKLANRLVKYEKEHFPLDEPSQEAMDAFMREQQIDVEHELKLAVTDGPRWAKEYREHLVSEKTEETFSYARFRIKRRELDFLIAEDPYSTDDRHSDQIRDLEEELGIYG